MRTRARHNTPPRQLPDSPSRNIPFLVQDSPLARSQDANVFTLNSPFRTGLSDDSPDLAESPTPSFAPLFPKAFATSRALRTPVKRSSFGDGLDDTERPSQTRRNSGYFLTDSLNSTETALHPPSPSARTSKTGGTKRKSANRSSTPLRQHTLTPLRIQSSTSPSTSRHHNDAFSPSNGVSDPLPLHRLAPLPTRRLKTGGPQTKAETDSRLQNQTTTMTQLHLTEDLAGRDQDGSVFDDDSHFRPRRNSSLGKKLGRQLAKNKAKQLAQSDEVAEDVSPGGHINKRRAKSRPVSLELLDSLVASKSSSSSLAFPSFSRDTPPSPLAESPHNRRRASGLSASASHNALRTQATQNASTTKRAPMARLESSATLLFGGPGISPRPSMSSRHSYGGDGSIASFGLPEASRFSGSGWTMRSPSRSPDSSPFTTAPAPESQVLRSLHANPDDDEDEFFSESSFSSTSIAGISHHDVSQISIKLDEVIPSPKKMPTNTTPILLPKKYQARDSGIGMIDDDDMLHLGGSLPSQSSFQFTNVMPRASTSVNTVSSDAEDAAALITPGFEPDGHSGWPIHVAGDNAMDVDVPEQPYPPAYKRQPPQVDELDNLIKQILEEGGKATFSDPDKKHVPDTPVKKAKKVPVGARPWQSAVATKVGLNFGVEPPGKSKPGKAPRKSLPAAFPLAMAMGRHAGSPPLDDDDGSDSGGEGEDSPSLAGGREVRYLGLGLGRPSANQTRSSAAPTPRFRSLLRRNSSGMFSVDSDSSLGTPTRPHRKDLRISPHLKKTGILDRHCSPSARSASSSSTSSIATLASPTTHRGLQANTAHRSTPLTPSQQRIPIGSQEPKSGRFDRDFVRLEDLGSGQFGSAFRVRRRDAGDGGEVSALKKSKTFEGPRHRLRLREEVEILQHLSITAQRACGSQRHPNVLGYLDSWEEGDCLYIQTELCEKGNLDYFLWTYGKQRPKLSEPRIWKSLVDLSSGLQFIHHAGVIHLDLKPANIFLTMEGRFKIGDFGMASLWPRRSTTSGGDDNTNSGFEREGDKLYMAPEVLQGRYGMAADIFSLGMIILEATTNIQVPSQGPSWHRLREEDLSETKWRGSPELFTLVSSMMRTDPADRVTVDSVCAHPMVCRTRLAMDRVFETSVDPDERFAASPLGNGPTAWVEYEFGAPKFMSHEHGIRL